MRIVAFAALFLVATTASATRVRLGPQQAIGRERPGDAPTNATGLIAARTAWGYAVLWIENRELRLARVTRDGRALDAAPLTIAKGFFTAPPRIATDGTELLVSYSKYNGTWVNEHLLVRITASREIAFESKLPAEVPAVLWTGSSYLVFIGSCTPGEVLQLDRAGVFMQSLALRLPERGCGEMAPLIFRDASGVFRLVLGDGFRIALTDANGNPVRDGTVDRPDPALSGGPYIAAGATAGGFYLLSETFIQFVDHDGHATGPRVELSAGSPKAVTDGDSVIVAGTRGDAIAAWRITPRGVVTPLRDVRDGEAKAVTALFATPTGVTAFVLISKFYSWVAIPKMAFLDRESTPGRIRTLVSLSLQVPDRFDVTAVAHGDGILVAWRQIYPKYEVHVAFLDSSAQPRPVFEITLPGDRRPLVAGNGETAMVVTQTAEGAWATRIDSEGRMDTPPFTPGLSVREVFWDGAGFLLHVEPGHGLRMLTGGSLGLWHPVSLAMEDGSLPIKLATSLHGVLAIYRRNRLPLDYRTEALYARALFHDLRPRGPAEVISILPTRTVDAVWCGDHYLVAVPESGLRGTRVSAAGKPLDGDLPQPLLDSYDSYRLARAGGRTFVVTRNAVSLLEDWTVTSTEMPPVNEISAVVTTGDGRTWLIYSLMQPSAPFAREITFE